MKKNGSNDNLSDGGYNHNIKITYIERFRSNSIDIIENSNSTDFGNEYIIWELDDDEGFIGDSQSNTFSSYIGDDYNIKYNMFYRYKLTFENVLYNGGQVIKSIDITTPPNKPTLTCVHSETDLLTFNWIHNSSGDAKRISYQFIIRENDDSDSDENNSIHDQLVDTNSITIYNLKHQTKYYAQIKITNIGDDILENSNDTINSITVFTPEINSISHPELNYKFTEMFWLENDDLNSVKSDIFIEYQSPTTNCVYYIQNWGNINSYDPIHIENGNSLLNDNSYIVFNSIGNSVSWYELDHHYTTSTKLKLNSEAENSTQSWEQSGLYSSITLLPSFNCEKKFIT